MLYVAFTLLRLLSWFCFCRCLVTDYEIVCRSFYAYLLSGTPAGPPPQRHQQQLQQRQLPWVPPVVRLVLQERRSRSGGVSALPGLAALCVSLASHLWGPPGAPAFQAMHSAGVDAQSLTAASAVLGRAWLIPHLLYLLMMILRACWGAQVQQAQLKRLDSDDFSANGHGCGRAKTAADPATVAAAAAEDIATVTNCCVSVMRSVGDALHRVLQWQSALVAQDAAATTATTATVAKPTRTAAAGDRRNSSTSSRQTSICPSDALVDVAVVFLPASADAAGASTRTSFNGSTVSGLGGWHKGSPWEEVPSATREPGGVRCCPAAARVLQQYFTRTQRSLLQTARGPCFVEVWVRTVGAVLSELAMQEQALASSSNSSNSNSNSTSSSKNRRSLVALGVVDTRGVTDAAARLSLPVEDTFVLASPALPGFDDRDDAGFSEEVSAAAVPAAQASAAASATGTTGAATVGGDGNKGKDSHHVEATATILTAATAAGTATERIVTFAHRLPSPMKGGPPQPLLRIYGPPPEALLAAAEVAAACQCGHADEKAFEKGDEEDEQQQPQKQRHDARYCDCGRLFFLNGTRASANACPPGTRVAAAVRVIPHKETSSAAAAETSSKGVYLLGLYGELQQPTPRVLQAAQRRSIRAAASPRNSECPTGSYGEAHLGLRAQLRVAQEAADALEVQKLWLAAAASCADKLWLAFRACLAACGSALALGSPCGPSTPRVGSSDALKCSVDDSTNSSNSNNTRKCCCCLDKTEERISPLSQAALNEISRALWWALPHLEHSPQQQRQTSAADGATASASGAAVAKADSQTDPQQPSTTRHFASNFLRLLSVSSVAGRGTTAADASLPSVQEAADRYLHMTPTMEHYSPPTAGPQLLGIGVSFLADLVWTGVVSTDEHQQQHRRRRCKMLSLKTSRRPPLCLTAETIAVCLVQLLLRWLLQHAQRRLISLWLLHQQQGQLLQRLVATACCGRPLLGRLLLRLVHAAIISATSPCSACGLPIAATESLDAAAAAAPLLPSAPCWHLLSLTGLGVRESDSATTHSTYAHLQQQQGEKAQSHSSPKGAAGGVVMGVAAAGPKAAPATDLAATAAVISPLGLLRPWGSSVSLRYVLLRAAFPLDTDAASWWRLEISLPTAEFEVVALTGYDVRLHVGCFFCAPSCF